MHLDLTCASSMHAELPTTSVADCLNEAEHVDKHCNLMSNLVTQQWGLGDTGCRPKADLLSYTPLVMYACALPLRQTGGAGWQPNVVAIHNS